MRMQRCALRPLGLIVLLAATWSWQAASAQQISMVRWVDVSWTRQPGSAVQISGNSSGSLWVLGTDLSADNGFNVYKWNGSQLVRQSLVPSGRRLAAAQGEGLWIVNDRNDVSFLPKSGAAPVPQNRKARDVAVGGDDSVWIIDSEPRAGGYGVYKRDGYSWVDMKTGAVQIAVAKDGTAWVVNEDGDIFTYNATTAAWDQKPGKAHAIRTGAESGKVWMLGSEPVSGGYSLYQWGPDWQSWDTYGSFAAVEITEVADTPWILQSDGALYSKSPPITTSGTIIGPLDAPAPQLLAPRRTESKGTLLCSSTGLNTCGDTNADYAGSYTLDTTCDSGFYDMIYGGTCWKCPDDTDGRGEWLRSADSVEKTTACWRVPKEATGKANKVRSPAWAWECPAGSFWDGYSPDGIGGSCWQCPSDLPRRTAAAVWADNACASSANETNPATLLTFNGCPAPSASKMDLAGKRTPGKPFLDIAAGWHQGVASGGCYACPVTDEAGNFLITERNASPIYDRGNNTGCSIRLKWQPGEFLEPGLAYMPGVKELIWEQRIFDTSEVTAYLYDMAESQGFGSATPEAKAWVTARWREIARNPYKSDAVRTIVFSLLKAALDKNEDKRTTAERKLIESFATYVRDRRTHLAQQALQMYDAWKVEDESYRRRSGQTNSLSQLFYYGTVPFNFQQALGSLMGLGGSGGSMIGSLYALNQFIQTAHSGRGTSLYVLTNGLNIFKSVHGLTAVSGATIIQVGFAILSSIAVDQFIAIQTARSTLEASLVQAEQPVDLGSLAAAENGEDMLYLYWSKAMDTNDVEDPQVVQWAAQAQARAEQQGYPAPPKDKSLTAAGEISVGNTISSGANAGVLAENRKLVSGNGRYEAVMQPDGNFVIYGPNRQFIWNSGSQGKGSSPYRLAVQADGNLVVYGASGAIWATGLRGGTAPYTLEMQDDANLVMYDSQRRAVWASGTQR